MTKTDYILNDTSCFNKSVNVKDYVIKATLSIIGLTGIVVGLPLIISSLF